MTAFVGWWHAHRPLFPAHLSTMMIFPSPLLNDGLHWLVACPQNAASRQLRAVERQQTELRPQAEADTGDEDARIATLTQTLQESKVTLAQEEVGQCRPGPSLVGTHKVPLLLASTRSLSCGRPHGPSCKKGPQGPPLVGVHNSCVQNMSHHQ